MIEMNNSTGSLLIIPRRRRPLPSPVRPARNAGLRTWQTTRLRSLSPNHRGCNCKRSPFRRRSGNRRWRGGGGRGRRRAGASGSESRNVSREEQPLKSPSRAGQQTGLQRDEPSLRRRKSLQRIWREVWLVLRVMLIIILQSWTKRWT